MIHLMVRQACVEHVEVLTISGFFLITFDTNSLILGLSKDHKPLF
jgi:hypothetical protein